MIDLPASTPQRTTLLAVFIIGLQILFAVVLLAINVVAENAPGRVVTSSLSAEAPASVNPTTLPDSVFRERTLPRMFCCERTPAIYRLRLTEADAETPNLAILVSSAHDNALLYVNGDLVGGVGSLASQTNTARRPALMRIPARYAEVGATVDIVTTRAIGFAHLRPFYVGNYDALYPSYLALRLLRSDLPYANAVIGAFIAIFCVCAAPLLGARGLLLSLSGLAASWVLQHLGLMITDPPWGALASAVIYLIGFLGTLAYVVWFFIEWTSAFDPRRGHSGKFNLLIGPWSAEARQRLGVSVFAVLVVGAALMLARLGIGAPMYALQDIDRVLGFAGLAAMGFCLIRIIAYIARGGMREPIEASSFLFVVLAAIADIVMVRFLSSYGVFLGVAATFFPLALMVSLAGRARSVFEAATATAERLNVLVTQREREIVANLDELQRRERETLLLEERGRIMRDMHDGIGGQLLGLLLQARANKLSGEGLVHGLEESLADLRVIVDSLEQGDGSLETVLGAFRARIEPRVEAAGAQLIWQIGNVHSTDFGPDRALQLYRLLQEACTNALKHGKPTRIEVTLARNGAGKIELSVIDNGAGFDPNAVTPGRGLANMRFRASRIGATLQVASGPQGSRISLEL